jgi:hypothetical protein
MAPELPSDLLVHACTNPHSEEDCVKAHLHNGNIDSALSHVYHNARLDPENFLDGPLSWNPATRLRQMLARPGIIVCTTSFKEHIELIFRRLLLVFVMALAPVVHWKQASSAYIRGLS